MAFLRLSNDKREGTAEAADYQCHIAHVEGTVASGLLICFLPNPTRKRGIDLCRFRDVWDWSLAYASGYDEHYESCVSFTLNMKIASLERRREGSTGFKSATSGISPSLTRRVMKTLQFIAKVSSTGCDLQL